MKSLNFLKESILLSNSSIKIPKKSCKEMSTLLLQYSLNNCSKGSLSLIRNNNISFSYSDIIGPYIQLSKEKDLFLKLSSSVYIDISFYISSIKEYSTLYDLFDNKSLLEKVLKIGEMKDIRLIYKAISIENNRDFLAIIEKHI